MNNIQEKDWAEDDWGGHSGMCSNPYGGDDEPSADCGYADSEDRGKRPPESEKG